MSPLPIVRPMKAIVRPKQIFGFSTCVMIFTVFILLTNISCSSQKPMSPSSHDFKPDWKLSQWPLKQLRFTSVFGESRKNHFHAGVDLSSYQGHIHPILTGNVLFSWEKNKNPFQKYPGTGNWLALWHGKHIVSTYLHLADGLPALQGQVNKDHLLGKSGNTGRSSGAHLHLAIMDMQEKKYFNPLEMLPAISDKLAPQIYHLVVNTPQGFSTIQTGNTILMSRPFPISVRVIDRFSPLEMHRRLGIYKLSATVNGTTTKTYRFDSIKIQSDGPTINDQKFSDIYANTEDYLIATARLPEGSNTIEVSAEDFNGHKSSRTFVFTVKHSH